MDIMELGAIGELVGGVAVIASLVYVGAQIRQNAYATRAASHHAAIDSFREWSQSVVEDGDVADVFLKGNSDQGSLSPQEQVRYTMLLFSLLRVWETIYYQSSVGTGERGLFRAEEANLHWLFAHSGVQDWWRDCPFSFNDEFNAYLDSFLPNSATEKQGA